MNEAQRVESEEKRRRGLQWACAVLGLTEDEKRSLELELAPYLRGQSSIEEMMAVLRRRYQRGDSRG